MIYIYIWYIHVYAYIISVYLRVLKMCDVYIEIQPKYLQPLHFRHKIARDAQQMAVKYSLHLL